MPSVAPSTNRKDVHQQKPAGVVKSSKPTNDEDLPTIIIREPTSAAVSLTVNTIICVTSNNSPRRPNEMLRNHEWDHLANLIPRKPRQKKRAQMLLSIRLILEQTRSS
jgi:hypothetical protein